MFFGALLRGRLQWHSSNALKHGTATMALQQRQNTVLVSAETGWRRLSNGNSTLVEAESGHPVNGYWMK
ncbi:hypothetical protein [Paenibacillus jilunlii]|uniref:hypothetical protein n=1 Tax=Paenibacillus jilunlii TaxID=682956 RepID=UPI00115FEDA7|nr:hypothetical protein [Paenibacillus jilunlii]